MTRHAPIPEGQAVNMGRRYYPADQLVHRFIRSANGLTCRSNCGLVVDYAALRLPGQHLDCGRCERTQQLIDEVFGHEREQPE